MEKTDLSKNESRLIAEECKDMNMDECMVLTKGRNKNGDLYFTFIANAHEYENWHGDCGWEEVVIPTNWHSCNDCGGELLLSATPRVQPFCPHCGSEAII